jgi:GTP-binding protein LepA
MLHLCFLPESSAALVLLSMDSGNAAHGNYPRAIEREFDMTVITTVPNVSYLAYTKRSGNTVYHQQPI